MKDKVACFFDSAAENWDKINHPDPAILEKITDIVGVSENCSVLDAGCGTGVLFPFFLKRNVKEITAVDVSENMLRGAQRKYPDKRITFVCRDIALFSCPRTFDCVLVHNAFPHFLRQKEAVEKLKELTSPGGRLTIAHSISRADVLRCHMDKPDISAELPEAQAIAEMFGDGFEDFTVISDEKCFIVSAVKKKC